jgi:hypothetical protein
MLPHPTTPRLPSITLSSATYCTYFPKYYSVPGATPRLPLITPPKRQSTSLPWSTQPQLRRLSIKQSRVATQKLPFRATLNRKNTTLMLQSTTPRPTLHLATTRQPPSYFIEEFKYYPAPNYYQTEVHIYCNSPDYVTTTHAAPTFTPKFWSISLDVLKDCWNTKLIDKVQVHVSIFSSSTFPGADNCMMWEIFPSAM